LPIISASYLRSAGPGPRWPAASCRFRCWCAPSGFAKAIGEFGATITFVSNIPGETQTISSAIYSLIQTPDGDTAALRLVIVSIVIAMGALIASEFFARRATQRLHGN
jgi:molybdate transport system permease protein